MKILITGVTGFIGKNLFRFLSKDYNVFGTGRKTSDNNNYIQLDFLGESTQLSDLKLEVDVIIHCASVLADTKNNKDINLFYDNVKISEFLIALAKKTRPQLIINLSTIGVYPSKDGTYSELDQIQPSSNFEGLYGLSKFCAEELLSFYYQKEATRIVHLRLGQTIGDGMRDDRIYSLMKKELEERNCISVWADGERMSSFLSIDFLQKTIHKIIQHRDVSGVFNVSEMNISYLELANQVISKYGKEDSKIELLSKGKKSKVLIDTQKIENLLKQI